jgi:hypothetical protein
LCLPRHPPLPRYNIPGPGSEPRYVPLPGEDSVFGDVYSTGSLGSDAYVKFDILSTAEPQYHYLNLDTSGKGRGRDQGPLKEQPSPGLLPSPAPTGKTRSCKTRVGKARKEDKRKGVQHRALQERCVHCHELYSQADNEAGSCRYSPDMLRQGIECIACLACAKCLLYHCHYEDENFTGQGNGSLVPTCLSNSPSLQTRTSARVTTARGTWGSGGWACPCWPCWCPASASTPSSPPATASAAPANSAEAATCPPSRAPSVKPSHTLPTLFLCNHHRIFSIYFAIHANTKTAV